MVTAVWSMKGGVGVSSIACMLAIGQVERAESTVLVDLVGDVPLVLGMDAVDGPGLTDWCATPSRSPQTLARIKQQVVRDLAVIVRGIGDLAGEADALLAALPELANVTIVDCGTLTSDLAAGVAAAAHDRIIVARPCYLALRALQETPVDPTGIVLLTERGRALGRTDVEAAVGAPVIAEVAVDSAIARALDSGLLKTRMPRSLVRTMASVIS